MLRIYISPELRNIFKYFMCLRSIRVFLLMGKWLQVSGRIKDQRKGDLSLNTEIELLSKVHHKNLVDLIGFCLDQGKQTLVYEFIPKGTLRENLMGMLLKLHHELLVKHLLMLLVAQI